MTRGGYDLIGHTRQRATGDTVQKAKWQLHKIGGSFARFMYPLQRSTRDEITAHLNLPRFSLPTRAKSSCHPVCVS
jgi:hypothetical protein